MPGVRRQVRVDINDGSAYPQQGGCARVWASERCNLSAGLKESGRSGSFQPRVRESERERERESEGPDPAQPSIVCPTSCPTSWRNTRLIYAEYAVWGKANHVRQDTRCRLHGLEQRHPPPVQGGERVSKTTENLVNIHCDGVAVWRHCNMAPPH